MATPKKKRKRTKARRIPPKRPHSIAKTPIVRTRRVVAAPRSKTPPRPKSKPPKTKAKAPKVKAKAKAKVHPKTARLKARPKAKARPKTLAKKRPTSAERARKRAAARGAATRALNRLESLSDPRTKKQRSVYAKAIASARAALKKTKASENTIRGRIGWITRRRNNGYRELANKHARLLGREAHGRDRADHQMLYAHLANESKRFKEFVEYADDLGIDRDTAVDHWFSPDA